MLQLSVCCRWLGRRVATCLAAVLAASLLAGCANQNVRLQVPSWMTPKARDLRGDLNWGKGADATRLPVGSFSVRLNDRQADGTSWRNSGDIFYTLPGLPITPTFQMANAPSPVLCLMSAEGAWACPGALTGQDERGRIPSPCHLSFDCEYDDLRLPEGEMFGVFVISHGAYLSDLVDAAVFSRRKVTTRDPAYIALNERLHQAVEKIVPALSDGERRRRQRAFQLFTVEECAIASCTMRQSTIKFVPAS